MSQTYFISDTHFGHENIIKYCNRPFASAEEMDRFIIKQWNSVVQADDIVWFLGDFCLKDRENCRELISKLNGHKRMVRGNHDHYSDDFYRDAGFDYVSKYPIILKKKFILSHTPPEKWSNDYFYIFGHVHDKITSIETNDGNCMCVCVDRHNFTPIRIKEFDDYNE